MKCKQCFYEMNACSLPLENPAEAQSKIISFLSDMPLVKNLNFFILSSLIYLAAKLVKKKIEIESLVTSLEIFAGKPIFWKQTKRNRPEKYHFPVYF